jgi:hypothetical protein
LKTQKQEQVQSSARSAGWLRWVQHFEEWNLSFCHLRGAQAAGQIRFCADFVEKFVSESICFGFCFIL